MFAFFRKPKHVIANNVYNMLVEHARNPLFYKDHYVADTIDGRFDLIIMHLVIVLRRYKQTDQLEMINDIQNCFFRDMDRNLREMGVGDISVPKKIKKMAEAFLGRSKTYDPLITSGGTQELAEAFSRNIEAADGRELDAESLALYALRLDRYLETIELELLSKGTFALLNPE